MIKLEAPVPALQATMVLPNPQSADVENQIHEMDLKRSMNGTKYTYIKSNDVKLLTYSFRLTRMKGLELRSFLQSFYRSRIRLTNHKDEVWLVQLDNNPFEFGGAGRAGGWPGSEVTTIQLQFKGTLE